MKTAVIGLMLLSICPLGIYLGEQLYQSTDPISFGIHSGRPMNYWDYVGFLALVFSVTSFLIAYWLFRRGD